MMSPSASPRNAPPRSALEIVSRALRACLASPLVRLLLSGAAATGLFFLWRWVNTESVDEQRAGDTSETIRIEGLKSFVVRQDGSDQKYWEIAADSVQLVDNQEAWLARGVSKGTLYRDDQPWITMSAPRVRLSNSSKNLDAVGGVKATGPDGFSFITPQARWLDAKKLVEIPGKVEATLHDLKFFAPHLSYQWVKGELECAEKVEVRAPGAVMRGSNLQANLQAREVKLSGGVELVFDPRVAKPPR